MDRWRSGGIWEIRFEQECDNIEGEEGDCYVKSFMKSADKGLLDVVPKDSQNQEQK